MTQQSDAIVAELARQMAQVRRVLGALIVQKLQRPPSEGGTPVATGAARGAWVVAELGDQIDVLNDKPYIMRLNDGWSKQAQAGFIEACIDEALDELEIVMSRPFRILLDGGELFEYHPARAA